jgi:dipeptidase E
MDLFLLSNSQVHGQTMFAHAAAPLIEFVAGRRVVFVPYALKDHAAYTSVVAGALPGLAISSIDDEPDLTATFAAKDVVVMVGGGNTFRLLKKLQDSGLLAPLRDAVRGGLPYMGSSAGTVLTSPTIRTTNDMPIVEPAGFASLGFMSVQLNCHYLDKRPDDTHMGESRQLRIEQFHEENDIAVLGLREGSWLEVHGDSAILGGALEARLFEAGAEPRELPAGSQLAQLLLR